MTRHRKTVLGLGVAGLALLFGGLAFALDNLAHHGEVLSRARARGAVPAVQGSSFAPTYLHIAVLALGILMALVAIWLTIRGRPVWGWYAAAPLPLSAFLIRFHVIPVFRLPGPLIWGNRAVSLADRWALLLAPIVFFTAALLASEWRRPEAGRNDPRLGRV